jgi:hypothetical protein
VRVSFAGKTEGVAEFSSRRPKYKDESRKSARNAEKDSSPLTHGTKAYFKHFSALPERPKADAVV